MLGDQSRTVLSLYPRVFHACHTRHVTDPETGRLVSAHQAQILDHLDTNEPTTLTDLARHSGVTAGTMSIHIDRLARRGYVRRVRDPVDGRRVRLTLTEGGARVRTGHQVLDPERVRMLLETLDEPERARAVEGLALLAAGAERIMASKRLSGLRPPPEAMRPEGG